jgi:hypothetical protein
LMCFSASGKSFSESAGSNKPMIVLRNSFADSAESSFLSNS